jgi:hypothetical protein
VPAPSLALLPLTRAQTFRLVLWSAVYGMFVGIVGAAITTYALGASAEVGVVIRLLGPLGLLIGGLAGRVRAPAMGILADAAGVELHGFWRTRRLPWSKVAAIGWSAPGRRFAVRTTTGAVKRGTGRMPRRVPADLARVAQEHGVEVVAASALTAAPAAAAP